MNVHLLYINELLAAIWHTFIGLLGAAISCILEVCVFVVYAIELQSSQRRRHHVWLSPQLSKLQAGNWNLISFPCKSRHDGVVGPPNI